MHSAALLLACCLSVSADGRVSDNSTGSLSDLAAAADSAGASGSVSTRTLQWSAPGRIPATGGASGPVIRVAQSSPASTWFGPAVGPYGGQPLPVEFTGADSVAQPPTVGAPQPVLPPWTNPALGRSPAALPDPVEKFGLPTIGTNYLRITTTPSARNLLMVWPEAQQYKYGWYSGDEFVYIPFSEAQGIPGAMQILEWNSFLRYSRRIGDRYVFSWTPEFNGGFWHVPAGSGLPPNVTELKSDFQLASVNPGPWNWQIGLTPQLNSDLRRTLDSNAYMLDGRLVALYRPAPQWTIAIGAEYLNRVHDYVIPYGGVIWTPNDRWEFKLFFPKARISYYMGKYYNLDTWAFLSQEYQIDAYQIDTYAGDKERGQWSQYQVLFGFDVAKSFYSAYLQCGYVYHRQAQFSGSTPNFGLNDAFILRTGVTY